MIMGKDAARDTVEWKEDPRQFNNNNKVEVLFQFSNKSTLFVWTRQIAHMDIFMQYTLDTLVYNSYYLKRHKCISSKLLQNSDYWREVKEKLLSLPLSLSITET